MLQSRCQTDSQDPPLAPLVHGIFLIVATLAKQEVIIRSLVKSLPLLLCSIFGMAGSASASCNSGPDYCTDDPRIPTLLAAKKKNLKAEFPDRLIVLLDRGVQCVARIQQSPNNFKMVVVKDGGSEEVSWDQDNENAGKAEIIAGTVKRFWIVNARRAFSCDGQPTYDQQSDYDSTDDVNTSLAIKCDSSGC